MIDVLWESNMTLELSMNVFFLVLYLSSTLCFGPNIIAHLWPNFIAHLFYGTFLTTYFIYHSFILLDIECWTNFMSPLRATVITPWGLIKSFEFVTGVVFPLTAMFWEAGCTLMDPILLYNPSNCSDINKASGDDLIYLYLSHTHQQ